MDRFEMNEDAQQGWTKMSHWADATYNKYKTTPTNYLSVALCFPTEASMNDVFDHISRAVERIGARRPDLTCFLDRAHQNSGLYLRAKADRAYIEFLRYPSPEGVNFPYNEMKAAGFFPASRFVDQRMAPKGNVAPETAYIIPALTLMFCPGNGGFALVVSMHRAFGGESCLGNFLRLLAAETVADSMFGAPVDMNSPWYEQPSLTLNLPRPPYFHDTEYTTLLAACPEYAALPATMDAFTAVYLHPSYNTRIFVIDLNTLGKIINKCNSGLVTQLIALGALAWAHTTRARVTAMPGLADLHGEDVPAFHAPFDFVDEKNKLFCGENAIRNYGGDATVTPVTTVDSLQTLVRSCDHEFAIIYIAERIAKSHRAVDEDYILKRDALFSKPEASTLAHTHEAYPSQSPGNFQMNYWDDMACNSKFWFPGVTVGGARPDAIRAVRPQTSKGAFGLVLPGRPDIKRNEWEFELTLQDGAMDLLEQDAGWMKYVKRVIG